MDFYKGVFLGPVLVGKGDNSFFFKMRLSRFCKWAPHIGNHSDAPPRQKYCFQINCSLDLVIIQ